MSRITIKDIAKLLQVNVSTVSRALKDHPDISVAMRARVQEVASELGYRPNFQAIHFRKKKSGLIGLILPDISMFFFPSVIKAVEDEIRKFGYNLIVFQSAESLQKEIQNLEICKGFGVEGVLVSISKETENSAHFEDFAIDGVPVVFFDKVVKNTNFPSVIIQDFDAGYTAVQHLLEKKRRHICGFFDNINLNISQLRYQGFRQAQLDYGIKPADDLVLFTKNLAEARHVFRSFLKTNPKVDAIFMMSDELLAIAMEVIYEMDKKVPEEIAVVCISDGYLPYFLQPKITHIQHSGIEVGRLAAGLLLEALQKPGGEDFSKEVVVATHLVKLDSV